MDQQIKSQPTDMKLIIKKIKLYSAILVMASCSPRLVRTSILDINDKHVIVKNGDIEVFWGFTGGSNTTKQNVIVLIPINYNDSISIQISDNSKVLINRSFKLSRGKYLYIDNSNGDYSVYSQNKKKPLI